MSTTPAALRDGAALARFRGTTPAGGASPASASRRTAVAEPSGTEAHMGDARRRLVKPALKPLSLSITYPCYNEEANVERVTRAALEAGRQVADDLEIVIVNDGSKDRTGEIADRLAAEIPEVRAVHNHPNRGYGGALSRGFKEATKNWIFYTDGDGQFDFKELAGILPLLETHDIVSCYRLDRKDPLMRKVNAFAWSTLVNALFRIGLRDIDCAFKIYPKPFIDAIDLHSRGALIDTEMLAKARNFGLKIAQVGVHHYPRTAGQQTGANLRVIARAFRELFKLHGQIRREGK
jgi:glycosyltransferase involved in cell wall biosynthesis